MKRLLALILVFLVFNSVLLSQEGKKKELLSKPDSSDTNTLPDLTVPDTDSSAEQKEDTGKEEIDLALMHISAGYYDYVNEDLLILKNNVEIKYQNLELYSDRLEFYRESMVMIAEGNVYFKQENDFINASKMEINLSNNTGIIYDADGYISEAFYIRGNRIIKHTDRDYEYENSELTSCDYSHRLWYFTSTSGSITREEYARLKNVVLWFGKIPVFYLPYLVYPVKSERSTGFLIPAAGYSAKRGFYIRNSFFWAISDYVDTTLSFDYYTKFGYKTSLEFRYVLGEGQAGTFAGLYSREYEDIFGETTDDPTNKYSINYLHRHYINRNLMALLKIEYVNIDNYYNLYGWNTNYSTKNQVNSFLSFSYNTDTPKGNVLLFFDIRKDLREEKGAELSKLPELKYSIMRTKILGELYFGFNASLTNFRYRSGMYNLQEQTFRYDYRNDRAIRAKSEMNFSYPLKVSSFLTITPSLNLMGAYYNRILDIYDENGNFYNNDLIDSNEFIYAYDTSVVTEGPKFYKVFIFSSESKMMHMVYPFFEYYFRPYYEQRRIPNLDGYDVFNPSNYFRYGITQKFLYKPRPGEKGKGSRSREIASISLYQNYDRFKQELLAYSLFDPARRTEEPKSDYYFDANLYPTSNFFLKLLIQYDPYYREFRSYNLDFGYHSSWIKTQINYSHYVVMQDIPDMTNFENTFYNRSNRYISSNTSLKIKDLIGLGFSLNYDLDRQEMRNGLFRVAYLHPCFSIQVAAIKEINYRYYTQNTEDWRFEFSFMFLNIGSVGSSDVPNDFVEEWGERNY